MIEIDWSKANCNICSNGYMRLVKTLNGKQKQKLFHVYIWEKTYGAIPCHCEIHHIDLNPSNNNISNLQLVTRVEHMRIHAGWKLIDGEWWKSCKCCGEIKLEYYFHKNHTSRHSFCKLCANKKYREYYLLHREKILKQTNLYKLNKRGEK